MTTTVDVGVDLGTTVTKAVALDGARQVVARASLPTRWERPRAEWCERDPADAVATVDRLLADLVLAAGDVRVRSVGFCSIAETGALVDPDGRAVSRLLAWHDPRGGRQAATWTQRWPPCSLRGPVSVSSVATFFKLLWWRDEAGLDLTGLQWLCLPELVCLGLGAGRYAERSMLGRTALWDIHDQAPFGAALDELGTRPRPRAAAGRRGLGAGSGARDDHPVEQARGAVLTVAGHDHLVAAAVLGAGGVGSLCDSMGTAEDCGGGRRPPPPVVVAGLVSRGLAVYPHVVDSTTCLLGALRTGLVLGRTLDTLGATTTEQRMAFDAAAPVDGAVAEVDVEGLDMADDHVSVTWAEGSTPTRCGRVCSPAPARRWSPRSPRCEAPGCRSTTWSSPAAGRACPRCSRAAWGSPKRTTHVTLEEPGALGSALLARWAATRHPEGSDPTSHEAPPAVWFTDPSA